MRYPNIFRAFLRAPWAILPAKLAEIAAFLALRMAGQQASSGLTARRRGAPVASAGNVAVLPLHGVLVQRANLVDESSGATSLEVFGRHFEQALADPGVKAIVLDIDSPGGAVYGVPEMAERIHAARKTKPVIAVGNSLVASAAYWLAANARELVMTPGGQVGSIGVVVAHEDFSKALEQEGVKTTLVYAGRRKVEGNPFEPLTEEARGALQAEVDRYYGMFVDAVARGRNRRPQTVRGGFGEGRVVGPEEAVRLGMADRIATLDTVLAELGVSPRSIRAIAGQIAGQVERPAQARREREIVLAEAESA